LPGFSEFIIKFPGNVFASFFFAIVPDSFIEGTFFIETVNSKFALKKFALNKFATGERATVKFAFLKLHFYKHCRIKKTPIPITVVESAALEKRVNNSTFCINIGKIAVHEYMFRPARRFLKFILKLLQLK
jgi:hypothetical protein